MIGEFCIVRCNDAGVHTGIVVSIFGRAVELKDARRLHYWSGCETLHECATIGPPGSCRISNPVKRILLLDACEVIPCEEQAVLNLSESRWNALYSKLA